MNDVEHTAEAVVKRGTPGSTLIPQYGQRRPWLMCVLTMDKIDIVVRRARECARRWAPTRQKPVVAIFQLRIRSSMATTVCESVEILPLASQLMESDSHVRFTKPLALDDPTSPGSCTYSLLKTRKSLRPQSH